MSIVSSRVTVAATPTPVALTQRGAEGLPDNTVATIKNAGGTSVFLGGSAVTAAAGFELAPGDVISVDLIIGDDVYGITAAGTSAVHVMRMRQ